jgi:hypothetical protein
MPTFSVDVPARTIDIELTSEEALRDVLDQDLLKEARRRDLLPPREAPTRVHTESWAPESLAHDLRTAFYARDASRFEAMATAIERGTLLAQIPDWEIA